MLARLRRQVRVQYEFPCIHTELILGSELQGKVRSWREIYGGYVQTGSLHHRQSRRDQGLVQGGVGVDVQSIGHAEMKIDLGRVARCDSYLFGSEKLDCRILICLPALSAG